MATYTYLMEYLPTRYAATIDQDCDRREVYSFKNGYASTNVKRRLAEKVSSITGYNKSEYVVLFIPASSQSKTDDRYYNVASYIQRETGVTATLSGIIANGTRESACRGGNRWSDKTHDYTFNSDVFRGKKVILIDDVITSGNSLVNCERALLGRGAKSVVGLFVAKTINPDRCNVA